MKTVALGGCVTADGRRAVVEVRGFDEPRGLRHRVGYPLALWCGDMSAYPEQMLTRLFESGATFVRSGTVRARWLTT